MFGKLSSKTCAALLFAAGLIISLALAYHLGSKWSWEEILVPVERIVDARPTQHDKAGRVWHGGFLPGDGHLLPGRGAVLFRFGVFQSGGKEDEPHADAWA